MNVNVGKTRVGRENVWNTDEKKWRTDLMKWIRFDNTSGVLCLATSHAKDGSR